MKMKFLGITETSKVLVLASIFFHGKLNLIFFLAFIYRIHAKA